MKSTNKKWILGGLATLAVVAPVSTLVACGSSATIPTLSDKGSEAFPGMTIGNLEDELRKTEDSAASKNFLSQIKYEVAEKMYEREQEASFDYQEAFLKWGIYSTKKEQLNKAKEILALIKSISGTATTSSQINFEDETNENYIGKLIGKPAGWKYSSDEVAAWVKNQSEKTVPATNDAQYSNIVAYNSKITSFKSTEEDLVKMTEKATKIDSTHRASFDWDANGIASDFPKLLKPISKIKELQTKTYNEAKDAFIENYRTKGDGSVEWSKERPTKYNGATTDEEAIKYLVNTSIQSSAFNGYQYAMNDSFTLEQFLAVDENGKKIFTWFEGQTLGDKETDTIAVDAAIKTSADKNVKVFTNDAKELLKTSSTSTTNTGYTSSDLITIDTKTIKPQSDKVTPLLSNKIYYLGRNTLLSNKIIADLTSAEEKANFDGNPILMTQALIMAKQPADSTLPWTFKKEDLISWLSFYGTAAPTQASQGLNLLLQSIGATTLETTVSAAGTQLTAEAAFKMIAEYVSNDPGSRRVSGEQGVKSLMDYMKSGDGGNVGGFAVGTLAAYADMHRVEITANAGTQGTPFLKALDDIIGSSSASGSTTPGQDLIANFVKELWKQIPDAVKNQVKAATDTTTANRAISQYINSLTDDEVKNKFGYILTNLLLEGDKDADKGTEAAYKVRDGVYVVPSEYGLHIVQITSESNEWNKKLMDDLKLVATEKSTSKAKVKWTDIYKSIFTTERIVETLLSDADIQKAVKEIPVTNTKLFDEWIKNNYIDLKTGATDTEKGEAIIAGAIKTINALKLEADSKRAREALQPRINDWLVGQIDKHFMEATTDVDTLYNALLYVLEGMPKASTTPVVTQPAPFDFTGDLAQIVKATSSVAKATLIALTGSQDANTLGYTLPTTLTSGITVTYEVVAGSATADSIKVKVTLTKGTDHASKEIILTGL